MATASVTLTATSAAMVIQYGDSFYNDNGPKKYDLGVTSELPGLHHLLLNFPSASDNVKYYKLQSGHLWVRRGNIVDRLIVKAYALQRFDAQTVTWESAESYDKEDVYTTKDVRAADSVAGSWVDFGQIDSLRVWTALSKRGAIGIAGNGEQLLIESPAEIYGGADNSWPYFVVDYDDESIVPMTVKYASGPHLGAYADRTKPIKFSWSAARKADEYCLEDQTQTNAVFEWRVSQSGGWDEQDPGNEVSPANPTDNTVTIPAGTFPSTSSIDWRVRVTGSSGEIYYSESYYTFTTADKTASATPVSPRESVEDGSAPIVFRWVAANPSGSTPTGADLQRWVSNAWVDLAHVDGPATTYAAPANTFAAGTNYWRVRAYNADGVAGPWSAFVSFTVVAAPLAPTVSVDAVPFAVIRWQVDGQQAWRATVDGKVYGPYFGTEKSFTLQDYLADGEHTVTVEVQGQYGLWSEPGSYTFTVANQPGDQIYLQGDFGIDAALRWDPPSQTNDYLIYRDGVQIGHTTARTFTDRVVQGEHEWVVINRLPGGYYSRSNTVQGELSTDQLALALLSGGDWLQLEKTATPSRMEDYAATQTVEIIHLAGQEYPEAETAPYKTMQASFAVAWNLSERAQTAAFEALIGKPIIYKAPSGETLVGVLQAWSKQVVHFYRAYTATVQWIHWRDYVEDD